MTLSVILIVKNEEEWLGEALESVSFADEIVVIDTGSTDKTKVVAKKYTKRVFDYAGKKDFASWRNFGLKNSTGDWVLYIDADERITPLLKKEILSAITKAEFAAYALPRKNFIFGKEFKHSGQYPDYQKRLFDTKYLKNWTGEVHESPNFTGQLGHLKNPMNHLKHISLTEMMDKTNFWSNFEAQMMYEAHHPPMTILRFFSAMFREFWLRMIKQMAFLDGPEGFIYALYQVYSRFVSYAKLWELQQNK